MIDLVITPLRSIGPFVLGTRADVVRQAALASGLQFRYRKRDIDYFEDNTLQISYDPDDTVSFIGVSANPERYRLLYGGIDVFDDEAVAIFDLIASNDGSGIHTFDTNSAAIYRFPKQIVTLYEADTQYDRIRRKSGLSPFRQVWAQIGIGTKSYYDSIVAASRRRTRLL